MAFGNKLRNRIVGVLVIVSIILILLPVMMQDRPVPNEPINIRGVSPSTYPSVCSTSYIMLVIAERVD